MATAAVGIPLLIGLVGWSPVFVFSGFFLLLTLAALWEFYAMVFPQQWFGRAAGILSGFGLAQFALAAGASVSSNLLVLALICVFAALLTYRESVELQLNSWFWTVQAEGRFDYPYRIKVTSILGLSSYGAALTSQLLVILGPLVTVPYWIDRWRAKRSVPGPATK